MESTLDPVGKGDTATAGSKALSGAASTTLRGRKGSEQKPSTPDTRMRIDEAESELSIENTLPSKTLCAVLPIGNVARLPVTACVDKRGSKKPATASSSGVILFT